MNALSSLTLAGLAAVILTTNLPQDKETKKDEPLQLGNFSISLTVKDIKASKAFYEKLDFKQVSGELEKNWVAIDKSTVKGFFNEIFQDHFLFHEECGIRMYHRTEDLAQVNLRWSCRGLTVMQKCQRKFDGAIDSFLQRLDLID